MNFRYFQVLIGFVFIEQLLCQTIQPFLQHINMSSVRESTEVLALDKLNFTNNTFALDSFESYRIDFSLGNIEEDVVFHFESKLPISISLIFNKDLPSESFEIPIEHEQFEGTGSYFSKLEFSKSVLNFIYGERSSIELKNQNNQAIEVNLTIDYRDKDFSTMIIIFAALLGIFILIAMVFCVIDYIRSLKSQNIPITYPEVLPTTNIEITEITVEAVEPVETPNEEGLTSQDLNHHFPGVHYEKLKSSFPQTSCSICLEELGPGINCHQLYCEHIFHSKCIQAWFKHQLPKYQACCPNCNQDMLRYSFVNYYLKNPL